MRIGYECLLSSPQEAGVGGSVRGLLKALATTATGDELTVFIQDGIVQESAEPHLVLRRCGLPRLGRPARIFWQQCVLPRLLSKEDIDVYHGTGYVVPRGLPVPSVVTVYDTIALERPWLTTGVNAAHYRWAVPRAVRASRYTIVPSDHVRRRVASLMDIDPRRVVVVPLGIARDFRPLQPAECKSRLRPLGLSDAPFLLCVGNIERKKNLGVALSAFECWRHLRPDGRLVLAGNAGNAYRNLLARIRRLDLERSVLFTGYVSRPVLTALYNRALALLYPSHDEGFGLPPLEAMACGCPVLASNAGALPETTGDAAWLLDPDAHWVWARAVVRVDADTALRDELAGKGYRHASHFSWERTAATVLSVYRAAAGLGQGGLP